MEAEALTAGVGLPFGLRKRVIWDEPVGALSNLLAVMNSDVIAQLGLVPAQRLICTASSHTGPWRKNLTILQVGSETMQGQIVPENSQAH